jgi:hypothetical protein
VAEDLEILFYWLWRQYRDIRTLARGATQPNLNVAIVKSLMVPVPDGSVSPRVVRTLNKLEMSVLSTRDQASRVSRKAREIVSQLLHSVNE